MKTKTKVIFSAIIVALLALTVVLSVALIFAAQQQSISSQISVSYKASEIEGKVSAKYYVGPEDTIGTAMTSDGTASGKTELVFHAADDQISPNTLNPQGDIILSVKDPYLGTPDKRWVVFEYVFQNGLGNPVSTDFTAKLSFDGTANNITITTFKSNERITDFSLITPPVSTPENFSTQLTLFHQEDAGEVTTKYFYVKAEIKNAAQNSAFSGNFNWDLVLIQPTLDKLTFTLSNDHYTVKAKDTSITGEVVIPSTFVGEDGVERQVTEIEDNAFENANLFTSVVIPESITKIGNKAFSGCYLLTDLNFNAINCERLVSDPYRSMQIFYGAGRDSTCGLSATFGDSVQKIPADIFTSPFGGPKLTQLIIGKNVKEIGGNACYYCSTLKTVIIPDSVEIIGAGAFARCASNLIIGIGSGVREIGRGAFDLTSSDSTFNCTIDSQTVCENLISWESDSSTKTSLMDYATTIKAKYEIAGIESYTTRKFTKSADKDNNGYWVYTKS